MGLVSSRVMGIDLHPVTVALARVPCHQPAEMSNPVDPVAVNYARSATLGV